MNKLKGIIYELVLHLASIGPRKKSSGKKILIVRVDEIGDYMLWHKFLQDFVTAAEYQEYTFHFCGNQSWKSLFETLDKGLVHHSYWMDKLRFKKEMGYRYHFLKNIYREQYDLVINPTYSRDKRYDDSIVKAAKTAQTVGMVANLENTRSYEVGYDKTLYTRLFDQAQKPIFEFYRNKLFTQFVTGQPSSVTGTEIETAKLPAIPVALPDKYFVVFPGSRSKARIWPAENFVRVSNYLFETHGWTAVICGTQTDTAYTSAFLLQFKHLTMDLTGKTSLPQMLALFSKAECLLSVDTGSVHLAAAVNCPVFGIFNGSQYARFAPYPNELSNNFYPVYPDEVEKELKDEELVRRKYEFIVRIPYDSVKPEKIIHAIYNHYSIQN